MECNKCNKKIELINKKNPETKMYYNYWNCEDCGKAEPRDPTCGVLGRFRFSGVDNFSLTLPEGLSVDPDKLVFVGGSAGNKSATIPLGGHRPDKA